MAHNLDVLDWSTGFLGWSPHPPLHFLHLPNFDSTQIDNSFVHHTSILTLLDKYHHNLTSLLFCHHKHVFLFMNQIIVVQNILRWIQNNLFVFTPQFTCIFAFTKIFGLAFVNIFISQPILPFVTFIALPFFFVVTFLFTFVPFIASLFFFCYLYSSSFFLCCCLCWSR